MAKELTAKRRAFVAEYLRNGRNGAAAYRAAYKSKSFPNVCAVEAAKLLKDPRIALIVGAAEEKAAAVIEKAADDYAVSRERIVAELARMGYANMLDYVRVGDDGDAYVDLSALDRDKAAAISEITVEDFKDGRGEDAREVRRVKFKLHDKRAALMDLAKIMNIVVDRKEMTLRVEDLTTEQLHAFARALGSGDEKPAARGRPH